MTNINCCEDCIYQKEGKCCLEKVDSQKISLHADCAYFVKVSKEYHFF